MKNCFVYLAIITAMSFGFESCNLNNTNTAPPSAYFLVAALSPDAPAFDIYVNGTLIQPPTLPFNSYYSYTQAAAGNYNFFVAPTGTTTQLLNTNIALTANTNYSVFLIDSVARLQAAVVTDNLTIPTGDSAKVRFLDFGPNVGSVDFAYPSGGAVVSGGRFFDDQAAIPAYANFVSVPAGNYSFEIRQAGTPNIILTATNEAFAAGKIYTLALAGFAGASGAQALTLSNIENY